MMTRSAVFVFLMLLLAGAVQAVEREHPAKAKVIQVDRDQKVLSLTVDDATVEVGDLFVVLREPDHAGIPEKNLAVIGIESIGKDQAVGKVLRILILQCLPLPILAWSFACASGTDPGRHRRHW